MEHNNSHPAHITPDTYTAAKAELDHLVENMPATTWHRTSAVHCLDDAAHIARDGIPGVVKADDDARYMYAYRWLLEAAEHVLGCFEPVTQRLANVLIQDGRHPTLGQIAAFYTKSAPAK